MGGLLQVALSLVPQPVIPRKPKTESNEPSSFIIIGYGVIRFRVQGLGVEGLGFKV